MDYMPLFFDLKGKPCLVVGGGDIAVRKATLLKRAGAHITVVSRRMGDGIKSLLPEPEHTLIERPYETADLDGVGLVIAATDNNDVNQQVSRDAKARALPVNVVDNPALCTFILPAIIDRSPIVIGVSSGGQSPVLARLVRSKLESTIPASYGRLGQLVGRFRDAVKQKFRDVNQRRIFWENILNGPIAEYVFSGKEKQAEAMLRERLEQASPEQTPKGEVYLVGAGPGDPDLLTFKALRLMQQADVVLYDRLVSPGVLDLVRRDADKVYVGKRRNDHAVPQENINQYLVDLAMKGHRVCRLKGGDPFIFGRGGEEIEKLAELGIDFQVVPGITAASGCASYSGIPLTHRDYSQSVRFVTGHLKDGAPDLEWDILARERQTLVFYMGLVGLGKICSELISHGMSPDMPIALIQQGTTPNQRVFTGTLVTMPDIVARNDVKAPTLIVVGRVVNLHHQLNWFDPESVDSAEHLLRDS
ncbi:MAG: siroheme synthase CysG [Ketobacteraceae bacterium]|nr:siroheme synthase CysG [Ketobacteraceae bacterium]